MSMRMMAISVTVLVAGIPAVAAGPMHNDISKGPLRGDIIRVQTADELPREMRIALIRGIQEELQDHRYDPGPADGVLGPRTRAAIRAYQRDAGFGIDGIPTKDLLEHLKFAEPAIYSGGQGVTRPPSVAAPAVSARPTSSEGAPKDLVTQVQRELAVRGYYQDDLDGVAGPNTKAAVRAFQRDAGLPVTGVVDERLLGELRVIDDEIRADRNRSS